MSHSAKFTQSLTLPLVALGGVAAFPGVMLNFEINDAASAQAAEAANATNSFILLISLREPTEGEYHIDDFCNIGTVAKIKQSVKSAEGSVRLLCEGYARAQIVALHRFADYYTAEVAYTPELPTAELTLRNEAMLRVAKTTLAEMAALLPNLSEDIVKDALAIEDTGAFCDFVAANVL